MHPAVFRRNGWQLDPRPQPLHGLVMPLLNLSADCVGIFGSQTRNRTSRHSQLLPNEPSHPFRSSHRGNRRRARSLQKLSARRIFRNFVPRHQIPPRNELYPEIYFKYLSFIPFYFLTALPRVLSSALSLFETTAAPRAACTPAASASLPSIFPPTLALLPFFPVLSKTTRNCTKFPVSSNTVWRAQTSFPPSPSRPSLRTRLPIIPPRDNNQISRRRKPLYRDQELRLNSRPTRVYFSRGHKKRAAYRSVRHSPSGCHRHQSPLQTRRALSRTSFPPG